MSRIGEHAPTTPPSDRAAALEAAGSAVKAGRILRQARTRAALSQSDLGTRAGIPRRTIYRIEQGLVDPRLGTMERLLGECGVILAAEGRPAVDDSVREEIRELLGLAPMARLAWRGDARWASKVSRMLTIMAASGVRLVVTRSTARRMHGAPVPVTDLEVLTRADYLNASRLRGVLPKGNRRWLTVGLTAISCDPRRFDELRYRADVIARAGTGSVRLEAIDDLIEHASAGDAEILRAVREEQHAAAAAAAMAGPHLRRV